MTVSRIETLTGRKVVVGRVKTGAEHDGQFRTNTCHKMGHKRVTKWDKLCHKMGQNGVTKRDKTGPKIGQKGCPKTGPRIYIH